MNIPAPNKDTVLLIPESTEKESPNFLDINYKGEPLNTDTNLNALAEFIGIGFRLNLMTFEPEVYDSDTDKSLDLSPEQIRSFLRSHAVRHGLNKVIVDDHLLALSENNKYHPVKKWLATSKWDGKSRIDEVITCLNAKHANVANIILKRWFVGVVASIYEESFKSKLVPVLQGGQSYRKTAFVERIANIMPQAFLEGAELNPDQKDSVLSCIKSFIIELGELERTNKNSQGSLKAFITKAVDTVRPPYARSDIKKPRQSHFIASVNGTDFLKDETGSSRFGIIEMIKPADIDKLNSLLGWHYDGTGSLKQTKPELLKQFWLEVKELYDSGFGWMLADKETAILAKINEPFNDKGNWYAYILEAYLSNPNNKYFNQWRRAANLVEDDIKLNATSTKVIGKALAKLASEGLLESEKRAGGVVVYSKPIQ